MSWSQDPQRTLIYAGDSGIFIYLEIYSIFLCIHLYHINNENWEIKTYLFIPLKITIANPLHVNVIFNFKSYLCFPKQKYLWEEWCSFTFLQIFLMEESWILIVFNSQSAEIRTSVEDSEDKPTSRSYALGKAGVVQWPFPMTVGILLWHYSNTQQVGIS